MQAVTVISTKSSDAFRAATSHPGPGATVRSTDTASGSRDRPATRPATASMAARPRVSVAMRAFTMSALTISYDEIG